MHERVIAAIIVVIAVVVVSNRQKRVAFASAVHSTTTTRDQDQRVEDLVRAIQDQELESERDVVVSTGEVDDAQGGAGVDEAHGADGGGVEDQPGGRGFADEGAQAVQDVGFVGLHVDVKVEEEDEDVWEQHVQYVGGGHD